jgi:succinate dehydrogenase/fumarate reductase flavoprotein subunit
MLPPKSNQWDESADVVIIGYGLAGAVAAITAHDLGANVMIVEKQPADSHCSCSSIAMGIFLSPSDVDRATEYMVALGQAGQQGMQWTDLDTVRAWVKYTAQNKDWLAKLGGNFKFFSKAVEFPQLPGADSMELWKYQGSGLRMMKFMYRYRRRDCLMIGVVR